MGRSSRRKHERQRWQPMQPATSMTFTRGGQQFVVTPEDARRLGLTDGDPWSNNRYSAIVRRLSAPWPFGPYLWISLHRLDRAALLDWRELQRAKNDIAGPECEAIQLFPAESRLVDTSNEFHIFCFPALAFDRRRFPFGHTERLLLRPEELPVEGAVQRPFEED